MDQVIVNVSPVATLPPPSELHDFINQLINFPDSPSPNNNYLIDEPIPEEVVEEVLREEEVLQEEQRREEQRREEQWREEQRRQEEQRILLEEKRRIQIQEDATLADLLQDEEEEDDNEEQVELGYESEQPSDDEEMMGQEQQQEIVRDIDSDMETEDNGHEGAPSDSDSVFEPEPSAQMREVALRLAINVRRRFHRDLRAVFRESRNNELGHLREQLRHVQQEARRQQRQELLDKPRRNIDFCFGCAKHFWCQRNRRWVGRCDACGFWLCPECNENPVHCQNERDYL